MLRVWLAGTPTSFHFLSFCLTQSFMQEDRCGQWSPHDMNRGDAMCVEENEASQDSPLSGAASTWDQSHLERARMLPLSSGYAVAAVSIPKLDPTLPHALFRNRSLNRPLGPTPDLFRSTSLIYVYVHLLRWHAAGGQRRFGVMVAPFWIHRAKSSIPYHRLCGRRGLLSPLGVEFRVFLPGTPTFFVFFNSF